MVFAPASMAFATAMALARSFSDAVGFCPSSFTHSFLMPSSSASFGSSYRGHQPTRRGVSGVVSSTGSSSRYRHMERFSRFCSFSFVSTDLM